MPIWLDADTISAKVRRRRRRRSLAAGVVVLAVAGTTIGLNVGEGSKPHQPVATKYGPVRLGNQPPHVGARLDGAVQLVGDATPLSKSDPSAVVAVADADNSLALALLQHGSLIDNSATSNLSISPFSLYVALAMLENGARGATEAQIAQALQSKDLDVTTQDAGIAELTSQLQSEAAANNIDLESANSLWQQKGFNLKPQFLSAMATYFHSGVWQVDFANRNAQAIAALNAWTSQHTHGKITKLFDELDPSTVLVLANALYFHAAWATPFSSAASEPELFTLADGRAIHPTFMTGLLQGLAEPDYDVAALPYAGGQYQAVAIMPTKTSLQSFVKAQGPSQLTTIADKATDAPGVEVHLPRFTTTSDNDLAPVLKALGMRDAFGAPDLSGLSSAPMLYVGQVIQRVYLGVGEKGTTAAAVTGIAIAQATALGPSGPPPILFNHPFLFLIRDKTTGAILFATEVNDPTSK